MDQDGEAEHGHRPESASRIQPDEQGALGPFIFAGDACGACKECQGRKSRNDGEQASPTQSAIPFRLGFLLCYSPRGLWVLGVPWVCAPKVVRRTQGSDRT